MKTKPARIFLILLLCAASTLVKGQSGNKISIGIGPELGIPFNSQHQNIHTRDVYKTGLGGSLKAELPVNTELHITLSAGYMAYKSKFNYQGYIYDYAGTLPTYGWTQKYIPLKAGLRYYFIKYMYAGADAGEAIKIGKSAKSSFIYSGGIGGALPIDSHQSIDLGLRYEKGYKVFDYNYAMAQLGISLAYKYQF